MLLAGKPGECMFTRAGVFGSFEPKDRPRLYAKTLEAEDDRLFALVASLAVEHRLERLMAAWLPDFDTEDIDFTFSIRLRMLEAAKIIPPQIIRAADVVRRVRNAFAHDIDVSRCEDLDKKVLGRLRACHVELFGEEDARSKLPRQHLQSAMFTADSGFDRYTPTLRWMNIYLRSDAFRTIMDEEGKKEHREFVRTVKDRGPKPPHPDDPPGVTRYAGLFEGEGDIVELGPDVKHYTIK